MAEANVKLTVPDDIGNDPVKQLRVFHHALGIYIERSEHRGELWKDFDLGDKVHHMRNKLERIAHFMHGDIEAKIALMVPEEILDEAFDLINYAAFFIRQAEARNNGTQP